MTACDDCGVTSRGAFIVEADDGRDLCEDCRGPGECERCGRETSEMTLVGTFRCRDCQEKQRDENRTRDAAQEGLDRWSE